MNHNHEGPKHVQSNQNQLLPDESKDGLLGSLLCLEQQACLLAAPPTPEDVMQRNLLTCVTAGCSAAALCRVGVAYSMADAASLFTGCAPSVTIAEPSNVSFLRALSGSPSSVSRSFTMSTWGT